MPFSDASGCENLLYRVKGNLGSAVFIHDSLVVMASGTGGKPLSFLRYAAVGKLPYKDAGDIVMIHVNFKIFPDNIRLPLLTPFTS